jgi:nitrate/nitrite transporter NarK
MVQISRSSLVSFPSPQFHLHLADENYDVDCNVNSNGFVSGLVGAAGNAGGIFYAMMFRFHTVQGYNVAWIIAGAYAIGVNLVAIGLRGPKA